MTSTSIRERAADAVRGPLLRRGRPVHCRAIFFAVDAEELVEHFYPRVLRRLKLLGAVAGVVVEDVLGELISRARRRGVVLLKLF